MKPDRTNYEIWLIDYLDGNLEPGQVEELMTFLDKNPDIKEEFDEIMRYNIRPPDNTFRHKNDLKRSYSQITDSQFDYLCIAAAEQDLSGQQLSELEEIIGESPEKGKTFDLIRNLKLTPPEVQYSKKHSLRKLTVSQKIIRLSAVGLSAAATVAIMISLFNVFAKNKNRENAGLAAVNFKDSLTIMINPEKIAVNKSSLDKTVIPQTSVRAASSVRKSLPVELKSNIPEVVVPDSSAGNTGFRSESLSKIDFKQSTALLEKSLPNTLLPVNLQVAGLSGKDESPDPGGLIARLIRRRILKTNDQESGSLKAYEVADAGILGLNKLFEGNMSLRKTRNEKGEIKSFYFSSKLLKFNVPVRKKES
jgi:hypothetical protein